jgi:hypothetical protein
LDERLYRAGLVSPKQPQIQVHLGTAFIVRSSRFQGELLQFLVNPVADDMARHRLDDMIGVRDRESTGFPGFEVVGNRLKRTQVERPINQIFMLNFPEFL